MGRENETQWGGEFHFPSIFPSAKQSFPMPQASFPIMIQTPLRGTQITVMNEDQATINTMNINQGNGQAIKKNVLICPRTSYDLLTRDTYWHQSIKKLKRDSCNGYQI